MYRGVCARSAVVHSKALWQGCEGSDAVLPGTDPSKEPPESTDQDNSVSVCPAVLHCLNTACLLASRALVLLSSQHAARLTPHPLASCQAPALKSDHRLRNLTQLATELRWHVACSLLARIAHAKVAAAAQLPCLQRCRPAVEAGSVGPAATTAVVHSSHQHLLVSAVAVKPMFGQNKQSTGNRCSLIHVLL